MEIEHLQSYGFEPRFINAWRASGRTTLLPFQAQTLARTGLLRGENVLVLAPTSAGKTFLAELAALAQVQQGKRAVLLVPTRALAEQQFRDLQAAYGTLGLRIVIATREHCEFDRSIMHGQFDIAVMVYEKMKSFLLSSPALLQRLGCVVADELQILGDARRGCAADFLLSLLRQTAPGVQIVGLSAVMEDSRSLADWLGVQVMRWTERSCPLLEGVYCEEDGRFRYRHSTTAAEGEETLLVPTEASGSVFSEDAFHYPTVEALCTSMVRTGQRGILVFVPTRQLSYQWALSLSMTLGMAPDAALEPVPLECENTYAWMRLKECMRARVGFHNSDLDNELRSVVEDAFQVGKIDILVATSTLAQGVNFACNTVIMLPWMVGDGDMHMRGPSLVPPGSPTTFSPLAVDKYKNQSGRAGRIVPGEGVVPGRSILVAATAADAKRLWNEYVLGTVDTPVPSVDDSALDQLILGTIFARGGTVKPDTLLPALVGTYGGAAQYESDRREFQQRVDEYLTLLIESELVRRKNSTGTLELSGLGQVMAAYGLQLPTMMEFACFVHEWEDRHPPADLMLLALCAFTADGQDVPVTANRRECMSGYFVQWSREELQKLRQHLPPGLEQNLAPAGGHSTYGHAAFKKCYLLSRWLTDLPTAEIEKEVRVLAGSLQSLGAHFSWLLHGLAAVWNTLKPGSADRLRAIRLLAARLPMGIPAEGVALSRYRAAGLTRGHILRLVREGYTNAPSIRSASIDELAQTLPFALARALHQAVQQPDGHDEPDWWDSSESDQAASGEVMSRGAVAGIADKVKAAQPQACDLAFRQGEEGTVWAFGKKLKLTMITYRLLHLLAENAGKLVSYQAIDERIWPDEKVEPQQVSAHKSTLIKRLAEITGAENAESLIETLPSFGLRLNMDTEKIRIENGLRVGRIDRRRPTSARRPRAH